jgi:hypothetical protein
MHDQNHNGRAAGAAIGDDREQVERELTGLVAQLVEEMKRLAGVALAQQRRIDQLERAVAREEVRS